MRNSDYIKIYTGNLVIVQRIASELKEEDIIAVIKDQNQSGLDPKIYGGHLLQEIYVHKDELDKAVLIVEDITTALKN